MAKTTSLDDAIMAPVDLSKLLASLDFSDEEIVEASKSQADLFITAARLRIQLMRQRTRLESETSVHRSQKGARVRAQLETSGTRVTEGQVTERVNKDSTTVTLQRQLNAAIEHEEYSKLLLEALRHRRDALKIVADVIGAEVYIQKIGLGATTELTQIKKRLEGKYPGRV